MAIQWHRRFDEALHQADIIAVARFVASYLGREPTRSELVAARRAANSYARASNAQTLHVQDEKGRRVLLLARVDADLSDADRLTGIAAAEPPRVRRGRNGPQVAESLVTAATKAGRKADHIDVAQIDCDHAQRLADELTEATVSLRRLRDRLERRAAST